MGTGIVSEALSLAHQQTLSLIVLVLAAGGWVVLAVLLGLRLVRDRSGVLAEARSPVGLTAVAATAVLGARIAPLGADPLAIALLVIALIAWLGLGAMLARRRQLPRTGSVFMLTVSVQSLAVLAAVISTTARALWLLDAALVACAVGIVLYPFALRRFDVRQLRSGAGDQWVAGGALAISALAASEISLAATRLTTLSAVRPALHIISVVVWAASMLWLPPLAGAEIAAPRFRYDTRRWATVFPVGMYAVCSYQVARVDNVDAISGFATVWTWISFGVWLLTFATMLTNGVRAGNRHRRERSLRDCHTPDNRRSPEIGAGQRRS